MKRYLAAFGIAGVVFAAVLGSAAALNIGDAGTVQFGQKMGVSCDRDGVTVDGYSLETNQDPVSTSYGVVVSGIDDTCAGKTIVARALDRDKNPIPGAYGTAVIGDSGTEPVHYANGAHVPARDIYGVQLTIG